MYIHILPNNYTNTLNRFTGAIAEALGYYSFNRRLDFALSADPVISQLNSLIRGSSKSGDFDLRYALQLSHWTFAGREIINMLSDQTCSPSLTPSCAVVMSSPVDIMNELIRLKTGENNAVVQHAKNAGMDNVVPAEFNIEQYWRDYERFFYGLKPDIVISVEEVSDLNVEPYHVSVRNPDPRWVKESGILIRCHPNFFEGRTQDEIVSRVTDTDLRQFQKALPRS